MLVLSDANLVYLAVPKTGSTAIEAALKKHADVTFTKSRKHITARRYRGEIAPFLKRQFGLRHLETCAVMRDPIDQLRSWYKYRARDKAPDAAVSTKAMSFDEFVRATLASDPPPVARVGSQFRFLTNRRGHLIVHHLFRYETLGLFTDFLSARLQDVIQIPRKNVSPARAAYLCAETEAALRIARADDFALYAKLVENDGYVGDALALT